MLSALPQQQNSQRVTIYVRNSMKKAVILTLPRHCPTEILKHKIQQKMKVPEHHQILFANGLMIDEESTRIQLQDKMIFHLVNSENVTSNILNISIKRIQKGSQVHQFNVQASTIIGEFISQQLSNFYPAIHDYFLVYTGRELCEQKTFKEEYVQHKSEILCIHRVENLKSVQNDNEKNQQKSLSDKQESSQHSDKENKLENSRNSQTETEDIYISNQQSYSVISKNNYGTQNANFKKKTRGVVQLQKEQQINQESIDIEESSKSYLPFSVISSRHQEEESIDCDKKESMERSNFSNSKILQESGYKKFSKQKSEYSKQSQQEALGIKLVGENSQIQIVSPSTQELRSEKLYKSEKEEQVLRSEQEAQILKDYNEQISFKNSAIKNKESSADCILDMTPSKGINHESISFINVNCSLNQMFSCEKNRDDTAKFQETPELKPRISENDQNSKQIKILDVDDEQIKKNKKKSEKSESLLLDNSQQCVLISKNQQSMAPGRFGVGSPKKENKNKKGLFFSDIIQSNQSKKEQKKSCTFAHNENVPINENSTIYVGDSEALGTKDILSSIFDQFDKKYSL